jgi:hypothetical protein
MQVETFECHETASEPIEANEEAVQLIEQLGLDGQRALLSKTDQPARCPYRVMTADETFVYRTLCPHSVKLAEYRDAPIPLRVLQVAAHAKALGIFKELHVWHAASAEEKDPVLVGLKEGRYSYETETFILARWGAELEAFAVLVKRAIAKAREKWNAQLSAVKSNVEAELAALQNDAAVMARSATGKYELDGPAIAR